MGRTALVITDDMVDELQGILTSAGVDVEKEIDRDIDSRLNLPPFLLHCKNDLGEKVDLDFARSALEPHELAVTFFTVYKSFLGSLKKTQLRSQIIELLLKHGAKDVNVDSENKDRGLDPKRESTNHFNT